MVNLHKHDDNSSHIKISTSRLEAFSDGVLAIIITIAVLEFKIPHGSHLQDLKPLLPLFITYLVSFQNIGTYWNNHHHLLLATKHISASIMWANLHLLFWLSLIPFATGWLGENHGGTWPTAFFAFILLMSGVAYSFLARRVIHHAENREQLKKEFEKSKKGAISLLCYALAIFFAFVNPVISDILILAVSVIWFIPDKRIEKYI
jgi:uncharacterized membrane protein